MEFTKIDLFKSLLEIQEKAESKGFAAWWDIEQTSANNGSIKFVFEKQGNRSRIKFEVESTKAEFNEDYQKVLQTIENEFKKIENIEL